MSLYVAIEVLKLALAAWIYKDPKMVRHAHLGLVGCVGGEEP